VINSPDNPNTSTGTRWRRLAGDIYAHLLPMRLLTLIETPLFGVSLVRLPVSDEVVPGAPMHNLPCDVVRLTFGRLSERIYDPRLPGATRVSHRWGVSRVAADSFRAPHGQRSPVWVLMMRGPITQDAGFLTHYADHGDTGQGAFTVRFIAPTTAEVEPPKFVE